MLVEVWSDVVCPWCYIGKRRLEEALESFPGREDVTIVHRAFQLDPTARSEGRRTVDVISEKYRTDAIATAAMLENVTEVASTVGLSYQLGGTLSGNTANAHRLLLWAQGLGSAQPLLESLYSGYFEQGLNIFSIDDLVAFAERAGLDPDAARAMLGTDEFVSDVAADQALAAQFGANGVPFFVFDRAYGISGAQPLQVFVDTLAKAAQGASE
ncbi:MAG: DsbA family oxidoreductase [Actinobacteria bacterium]|uniref:Unannotated protein n=1 Tax=freshwater metagenome TaxID=449393 RepID=A0A6J7EYY0_9ZZZZ|nr:DsbA family oxidoreductase [Actinomycetota bacterium]